MVTCPKCGRPVSGRARSCGYCGESLVTEYFRQPEQQEPQPHPKTAGAIASMVLGILGALVLLAALIFRLLPLFGFGASVETTTAWWVVTVLMTLLPSIYLMMQISLRGERMSLLPDGVSLFCAVLVLSLVVQIYLMQGITPFAGAEAIAYLLTLGGSLVTAASIAGILSYRKPS